MSPEACIYDDVHELGNKRAVCKRHDCLCAVKPCHAFGCGFSCTSVSHLNKHSSDNKATLTMGGNTTADTFNSSLAYLKEMRPWFVVMENVEGLDEKPDTPDEA